MARSRFLQALHLLLACLLLFLCRESHGTQFSSNAVRHIGKASLRNLLDTVSTSNTRSGPDGSQIAVDVVDTSSSVPKGTATAAAAGVTALQGKAGSTAGGAEAHQTSSGRNAKAVAGTTTVSVMQGFAKAAKGPAKGAAKTTAVPVEAAARAEPALKPEEYPDWTSQLVTPGKTLGELRRKEESQRTMLENKRLIKLSQRASIKETNLSKAKGV